MDVDTVLSERFNVAERLTAIYELLPQGLLDPGCHDPVAWFHVVSVLRLIAELLFEAN